MEDYESFGGSSCVLGSGPFGNEVARVLGGGLVPGSLVLVGGDPGVGKSTLLLQACNSCKAFFSCQFLHLNWQIAAIIAEGRDVGEPVVYVSGEESVEQIGNRADRMEIGTEELFLYSSTDVEVKECILALLRFAKKSNIPILLAGHVTKSGDIAGPRVLQHIVDAVLYVEGEKCSSYRLLRAVKNRFGSIDELGVFEMSQLGLQVVSNPSQMFLSKQHSDSDVLAGLAVAVIMDGTRTFLTEIQYSVVLSFRVLLLYVCLVTDFQNMSNGIKASRADMIIADNLKVQDSFVMMLPFQIDLRFSWSKPVCSFEKT
ncbi:hypothetical protein Patl1_34036 [Pistacia atlantica]|uniref:Uncharacterized protein n=1 Tax=Pistacia atlantica TaxID=434234 RepID=A0ACC0ZVV4_9ROSI|nr:hypothetical protein Patl1_34036 [Pistacia atlantica]